MNLAEGKSFLLETFAFRSHPTILYGASPRATVALLLCSKALATIHGRDSVTSDAVISDIIKTVEVPR